uniref:Uncharacterized protein LOC113799200 n=1 Tax=Dermatophagoides pteronyssinus TaxID=6956 RepID=A0A6P6YLG3_DERPT|nr:uncharacterized protein LOC113799200 [Dermatophagoides pteronyssinus]
MKPHLSKYRNILTNLSIKMLMNGPIRQENYLFGFDHLNRKQFNHLYEKYQQVKHNEWYNEDVGFTLIDGIIIRSIMIEVAIYLFIVRSFFLAIFIDKNDKQNLYLTLFGSGFRLINGDTFCLEMTTCLLSLVALIQCMIMLFAYTKSAAKFNIQLYRISIHDLQTILPKYRITFRNHIKIINHITLIDTNALIFHQSDGIKLGPITQVTIIAQIMAMYFLIMQLLIKKNFKL